LERAERVHLAGFLFEFLGVLMDLLFDLGSHTGCLSLAYSALGLVGEFDHE
jgi:hypothetical protein